MADATSEVRAAEAAPITKHPLNKFYHALMAILKFWPFWVILLAVGVGFAVWERAGKGAVTGLVPIVGPWARSFAVRDTTVTTTPAAPSASTAGPDAGTPPY